MKRYWLWSSWFAVFFLAAASVANAASVLNFPRLSVLPGTFTGAAVVNPSGQEAIVRLTAYGADGSELASTELTIPAGQQRSALTENLFPGLDPEASGWFRAVSDTEGLTGFFLFLDSALTELDGADLPLAARRLVFSPVQVGNGFSTELNLVNPNPSAASIRLTLRGSDAGPVERMLMLPALGSARLDAAAFFAISEAGAGAYVVAESPADILGFELVRLADEDLLGLNARPIAERLNTLYFPQFAVGTGIRTELGLTNLSPDALVATITAHRPDGSLYGQGEVDQNPVVRALAAGQSLREDLDEAFGFAGQSDREGWLEVASDSSALSGRITYRIPGAGAAAAVTTTPRGARQAIFSHIATTRGFFTGIAGLNPGTLPADVRIVAVSAAGEILGRFDMLVRPGNRFSRLVPDLIPGADGQAGGFVFVSSSAPLFLTSLFGTNEGSVLANIPSQPAPGDFRPDPNSPRLSVNPSLASLQPGGTMLFQAEGGDSTVWRVDGENGSGSINQSGLYQAPNDFPGQSPVIVAAESGDLTASAAVDLLPNDQAAQTQGAVRSLSYLRGLGRFYSLESFPNGPASAVFEISASLQRTLIAEFSDETISKMIPFQSRDGVESLLLAAADSGAVLRLDPLSGATQEVAAGLNAPNSMALDPVSGNLLVSQADRVTSIARSQLESGNEPAEARDFRLAPALASTRGAAGVAVDQCSGNFLFSDAEGGRVLEYNRADGTVRAVAEGLVGPSQLLALYRRGVTCPDALHLAVVQDAPEPIALVVPHLNLTVSPWVPVEANDAAPAPLGAAGVFVFVAQGEDSDGAIHRIQVGEVYAESPPNSPVAAVEAPDVSGPGPDLAIDSATAQVGGAASLGVVFRGDGSLEIGTIVFSIDYDQTRLEFDPGDADNDGLPDAIQSGLPQGYTLRVFFDPEDEDGEIDVVATDLTGLQAIPAGTLLNVTFGVRQATAGTAEVGFSAAPSPSIADRSASRVGLSETVSGGVTILP